MGNFSFKETILQGVYVIETKAYKDHRGYFKETYNIESFSQYLDLEFVQDNTSLSKKGVLRGLHYQEPHYQGKLVRVVQGEVYDVAVDIRPSSKTYGQYFGIRLSEDNHRQLYVPEGLAHGFLVLSEEAKVSYKCTALYHPKEEKGLHWNDERIGIKWPVKELEEIIVNQRDNEFPTLDEIEANQ